MFTLTNLFEQRSAFFFKFKKKPVNESKWVEMSHCEMVNIALEIEKIVNGLLLGVHNCGRINADNNVKSLFLNC
jgi:hypothetical protein